MKRLIVDSTIITSFWIIVIEMMIIKMMYFKIWSVYVIGNAMDCLLNVIYVSIVYTTRKAPRGSIVLTGVGLHPSKHPRQPHTRPRTQQQPGTHTT